MKTIIRHIEYLIARKDCVIIPGVGAILATNINARIDRANSLLLPPERVYTFNKDLDHNDGTLACSIARAETLRYEQACKIMETDVDSMLHQLHTEGKLVLGRIGVLHHNKLDGTIQFEPTIGNLSACANMWLPTFKLSNKKITTVASDGANPQNKIKKTSIIRNQGSIFRRLSKLAASIALVIGICFLATLLPTSQNPEAMKASLAPEFGTVSSENNNAKANEILTIFSSDKYKSYSEIDIKALDSSATLISTVDTVTASPLHYIVVAALRSDKDANLYLSQHPGEGLTAMAYKNMYVVYNSTCTDKNDAFKLCSQAAKNYPGAWICTK